MRQKMAYIVQMSHHVPKDFIETLLKTPRQRNKNVTKQKV